MYGKRMVLALLLCVLCASLCACTSDGVPFVTSDAPQITLPPASSDAVAPIGDAALEFTSNASLYLPRHDGTRLVAVNVPVAFSAARPHAESLARALLNYAGNGVASALGGSVRLSLYGVNPVEVSSDVATVNLAASALQLDRRAFYIACQAITNTLTELADINYVNVLVVDKPVGLDIANTLPMGAFTRSAGQDMAAVYEQQLARRVEASESAAEKQLAANVTLYFPLRHTYGVVSEVRTCSFASQALGDMVTVVLRELAAGPQHSIDSPALPLLADLLTEKPTLAYSQESGGQVITLRFAYTLDDMLEGYGLTRARSMASICYTLCTFFPNTAGISVSIGDSPVSTLMLTDDFQSSVVFGRDVQRRADFSSLLYNDCTLYFMSADGGKLVSVRRPIPYAHQRSPRALLLELTKGPQACDSKIGLTSPMPLGAFTDADILGLALADHTLLVNLTPAFAEIGAEMTEQQDRMLAYALVNTLCADEAISGVRFFVAGAAFAGFSGKIYWPGLFYPMLY
ncbi:MAG: GerMN domain-containing protein [Clostridia bacterium]